MEATQNFTHRLIERKAYEYWGPGYSHGTNILNFITEMNVHEDELAKADQFTIKV